MPPTLATDPAYPEVDEEVTLSIPNANGDPAYSRFELTSVPDQSELELGMLVNAAGDYVQTITPDVAGIYMFRLYDVRAYVGLSQFAGDTAGGVRQIIIETGDTDEVSMYVIAPMDLRIQTLPGHDITLRLGVADDLLISAEFVDPATDLARLGGLHTTAASVMDALVPASPAAPLALTDLTTPLDARVNTLRTKFEAHRVLTVGPVHASADTTNVADREAVRSDESAILTLNEIYDRLLGHMMAGASGGTWHTEDDTKNLPITPKASTKMQAHVTCSDLERRVYELHRQQTATPASHTVADGSNPLGAADELTDVIVTYLNYIAENTVGAVDGEAGAKTLAERRLGVMPAP